MILLTLQPFCKCSIVYFLQIGISIAPKHPHLGSETHLSVLKQCIFAPTTLTVHLRHGRVITVLGLEQWSLDQPAGTVIGSKGLRRMR